MAKYRDEVETILTVRNDALAGMRQAEQQMREQAQRERQRAQQQMREQAQQERVSVGAIAQRVVAAAALQAGLHGANVASEVLRGNFEGAVEALERMPLGVGEAARQLKVLVGNVTGLTEETERYKRIVEQLDEAQALRWRNFDQRMKAEITHLREVRGLRQDIAVLQAKPGEREGMRFEFRNLNTIEDAEARIVELRAKARENALAFNNEERRAARERISTLRQEIMQDEQRIDAIRAMRERGLFGGQQDLEGIQRDRAEKQRELNALLATERERIESIVGPKREIARIENEVIPLLKQKIELQRKEREDAAMAARDAARRERLEREQDARENAVAMMQQEWAAQHARQREIQRQQQEDLEAEIRPFDEQIAQLRAQAARMRMQAMPTPLADLDQNRFLTGVREQTMAQDRAEQSQQERIAKGVERQIKTLEDSKRLLEQMLRQAQEDSRRGVPLYIPDHL